MSTPNLHQIRGASFALANGRATVCVVDPNFNDYRDWGSLAEAGGIRLMLFATGEEALRAARSEKVDLWVVNTRLPGLSGFELCGMLKNQASAVCLVADSYSPETEQAAWQGQATLFACKPTHTAHIEAWLDHWNTSVVQMSGDAPSPLSRAASRALAAR